MNKKRNLAVSFMAELLPVTRLESIHSLHELEQFFHIVFFRSGYRVI